MLNLKLDRGFDWWHTFTDVIKQLTSEDSFVTENSCLIRDQINEYNIEIFLPPSNAYKFFFGGETNSFCHTKHSTIRYWYSGLTYLLRSMDLFVMTIHLWWNSTLGSPEVWRQSGYFPHQTNLINILPEANIRVLILHSIKSFYYIINWPSLSKFLPSTKTKISEYRLKSWVLPAFCRNLYQSNVSLGVVLIPVLEKQRNTTWRVTEGAV